MEVVERKREGGWGKLETRKQKLEGERGEAGREYRSSRDTYRRG